MTVILAVSGSLQSRSTNRAALAVAAAALAADDVAVEIWDDLAAVPAFDPDRESDPGTALGHLRDRLAAADGVLIATPEYAAAIPGALKNALDWLVGSADLYGKPIAILSAGTTGGHHARHQLVRSLTWQGAHVIGHLGIEAPRAKSDDKGHLVEMATVAEVGGLARRLVEAIAMDAADRLALVEQVTHAAGIEPGHVAPVPES